MGRIPALLFSIRNGDVRVGRLVRFTEISRYNT